MNGVPYRNPITLVTESMFNFVDSKIRDSLFPFQVEGIKYMIGRSGRCLLADDMGLGKTIQALGAASYYREEWPLLVICPSSVKMMWRDQIIRWITEPITVNVIKTSRDINQPCYKNLTKNDIVLGSYDLVAKLDIQLKKMDFKVIILDECHLIKSFKTERAKSCLPLLKNAKRVFLLSGTPVLSRPNELFTQIDAVYPTLFNGYFTEYGSRYCDPKKMPFGVSYDGSSNMSELQILLEETVMLRRMKNDVLSQLPEKRRQVIILAPELVKKKSLEAHAKIMLQNNLKGMERRGALLEYFSETGKVKIGAIMNYIDDLLETPRKFLFFAHHLIVLDAVEEQLKKKKVGYIRIDGSTSAELKRDRTEQFQVQDNVQVAILSIVAAGTGITLTAATMVVFGELFWNPGILLQAENRCHRIGQKNFVNIYYLLAEQTADDYIWPMVSQKLDLLTKVGLNKENFNNTEATRFESSFSEGRGENNALDCNFFEDWMFADINEDELKASVSLPLYDKPSENKPTNEIQIRPSEPVISETIPGNQFVGTSNSNESFIDDELLSAVFADSGWS